VGLVQPRELVLNYAREEQVDDSFFDPASYLDGSSPVLHFDGFTDPSLKVAGGCFCFLQATTDQPEDLPRLRRSIIGQAVRQGITGARARQAP
jgi:hypothetical protein